MLMSMKARFLTRLRSNVEAWRTGEIDYATYTECQRDTVQAIQAAGPEVVTAVILTLQGALTLTDATACAGDLETEPYWLERRMECRRRRCYRGQIERTTAGSPVLTLLAGNPCNRHTEHRQMTAFVYELAADMERRSQLIEAHWTISPDADNRRVVIELTGDHETDLAGELVKNVLRRHQLT